MTAAEVDTLRITHSGIAQIDSEWITKEQKKALGKLEGQAFMHKWTFDEALAGTTPDWNPRANDIRFNDNLRNQLSHIYRYFRVGSD